MKNKLPLCTILFLSIFAQLFLFNVTFLAQSPPAPNQNSKPIARPSIKDLSLKRPYISVDLNYSVSLPEPTYSDDWIFQEGKISITVANPNIVNGKPNFKEFIQINNNSDNDNA